MWELFWKSGDFIWNDPFYCDKFLSNLTGLLQATVENLMLNKPWIDKLRISHNASGMEANIRVLVT